MRRLRCEESRLVVMEFGCFSLRAMRIAPPQARHARVEGEESQHGQLVGGTGGEYEESGQFEEQRYL